MINPHPHLGTLNRSPPDAAVMTAPQPQKPRSGPLKTLLTIGLFIVAAYFIGGTAMQIYREGEYRRLSGMCGSQSDQAVAACYEACQYTDHYQELCISIADSARGLRRLNKAFEETRP